MSIAFNLIRQATVVFATVAVSLTSACYMGTADDDVPREVSPDEASRVISRVVKSMKTAHSYRVDGSVKMHHLDGQLDKQVFVRGDYVSPDRLELDVEGLRRYTTEQLVIVGNRAYQRERHGPSIRDRSDWIEFRADAVDPAYTVGVPDLTLNIEEYLSGIDWTSIEPVEGGAWLRGGTRSEGGGVSTHYRMFVREAGPLPFITLKHWVYKLDTLTTDRSGPERVVLRKASYKFSLFTHPLEVEPPIP
ncbi:MAG: hypothetical protein J4G13_15965 [Dehalococcoidia bacterium]|nr:hypothetical protein [Dehalococcoidia bacterium]